MKRLLRRWFKAWLTAVICLTALMTFVIAPGFRSRAQSGAAYTITDLGPTGGLGKAYGLNNTGYVVGEFSTTPAGAKHSFLWRGASLINLEAAVTTNSGVASALNNSGYAVGNFDAGGGPRAFIWHDNDNDGVSDPGELQDLGVPTGDSIAAAWDINDSNQVVGQSEAQGDTLGGHAVVWTTGQPGSAQILMTLNGIEPAVARGINNLGHIVGVDVNNHAFFFDGMSNFDIGTFGGPQSFPYAVSDSDYVVGWAQFSSMSAQFPTHAFIWNNAGGLKDLGMLSGDSNSIAYDLSTVNGAIQVVGASTDSGTSRAVIWQDADGDGQGAGDPNEMKDLNTLISDASWALQEARAINSGGQIAGFGIKDGETHAFLLSPMSAPTPTPTPTPTPEVTIGISPAPALVTESGATNLAFTFTRTGGTTNPLTVNLSVGGTATFGSDYTQTGATTFSSSSGTVTIGSGNNSATVTIDPAADSILEGDETVTLTVTPGTGYNVANPSAATGTITPDPPIVFTEMGMSNAVAVDSVTFARGPFRLTDDHNFSGDHLTRVILITSNLGMTQQDLTQGILSVRVAGYANPLPIENVGTLTIVADPAFNVSYIVVRLPADLPNPMPGPNNLTLTVKMGSAESNATILSIAP